MKDLSIIELKQLLNELYDEQYEMEIDGECPRALMEQIEDVLREIARRKR